MELSMYEETHSQFSAKGPQDLGQFHEPTVIFTALFCFIAFVIFLIMFSDKIFIETSSSSIQLTVPELSMVIAKLPFQVDFEHLDKATITGGIDVKISTTEPVEMSCYWGASCQLFIHALNSDPFYLLYEVEHLDQVESTSMTVCRGDEQSFHLVPEASKDLNFGPPPRSKYPLVIMLRCSCDDDSDNENTIVGGIWILHLPDWSFNTPGHIISNLVITNHGLVHNLQKMYMAADTVNTVNSNPSPNIAEVSSSRQAQVNTTRDGLTQTSNTCENGTSQSSQNVHGYATGQSHAASSTTAATLSYNSNGTCQSQGVTRTNTIHKESSSGNSSASAPNSSAETLGEDSFDTLYDGQHDCTVCQNSPISRVILPCRHVCICEECLHLVSKCPMCRGPVTSHFSLYPNTTEGHREDVEAGDNSWLGYLQQLNDRLNRSLGFT